MSKNYQTNVFLDDFRDLRSAYQKNGAIPVDVRCGRLRNLLAAIETHEADIILALALDFGSRSEYETSLNELFPVIVALKQAIKELPAWSSIKKQKVSWLFKPSKAYLLPQAKGVVGIVSPWNYPFLLSISPLIPAISAGNRVMLRPSSRTRNTSRVIQKICAEVFPPDEVKICGAAQASASDFTALPFDHLFFTGSARVGKGIMRQASENLTPLTLELGGKNPVVIMEDYAIKIAARSVARGKMMNAGQACIAPDHVYVPRGKTDDFIREYVDAINDFYPGDVTDSGLTSLLMDTDIDRLRGYVRDAQDKGARIIYPFGEKPLEPSATGQFPPILVTDCQEDMLLMKDELFGPILSVLPYDTLEDCLARINEQPQPLALYLFTNDNSLINKVQRSTSSGGLCINETLLHFAQKNLPFGGVGQSGMGSYHGKTGFDTFSHLKPVYHHSRFNSTKMLYPPFQPQLLKMLKFIKRFV
ncbi:MAG: aldehyde dehydrogenase family protein [Emcibacter sp.]|nr:aldehyde dehydrogenase family protein [Emcibacter sp.]